jgi:hypothetical protein
VHEPGDQGLVLNNKNYLICELHHNEILIKVVAAGGLCFTLWKILLH